MEAQAPPVRSTPASCTSGPSRTARCRDMSNSPTRASSATPSASNDESSLDHAHAVIRRRPLHAIEKTGAADAARLLLARSASGVGVRRSLAEEHSAYAGPATTQQHEAPASRLLTSVG